MVGDGIKITVLKIQSGKVRIGIEAPKDVAVHRTEVYDKKGKRNHEQDSKEE